MVLGNPIRNSRGEVASTSAIEAPNVRAGETDPNLFANFSEGAAAELLEWERQLQQFYNQEKALRAQEGPITAEQMVSPQVVPLLGAYVARKQWQDYQKRFMPVEDRLMGESAFYNPAVAEGQINAGRTAASRAIDTAAGVTKQRVAALGGGINPEMQARLDKRLGNQRALSVVDAANRIRQNLAERSRNIAFTGGAAGRQGIVQGINDQAMKASA